MSIKWCNVFPEVPEEFHERVVTTLETQANKKTNERKVFYMKKKSIIAVAAAFVLLGAVAVSALTGLPGFVLDMFGNKGNKIDNCIKAVSLAKYFFQFVFYLRFFFGSDVTFNLCCSFKFALAVSSVKVKKLPALLDCQS